MISYFSKSARDLSKNPLGIIALFIVLVYGFACLLFGFSAGTLTVEERQPLIWFVILFPVIVLILFGWLVSRHHNKLYSPSDYREDKSFLTTVQQPSIRNAEEVNQSSKQIEELMKYGENFEIISEQEETINKDLNMRGLNIENDTQKVLIRHLAGAQVINWFEKTYNTLFGSQISLLRKLSELEQGMSKNDLLKHFDSVKNKYPEILDKWSLSNYLKFLYDSGLTVKQDNNVILTKRGAEFLKLLSESGYTEEKSL